MGSLPIRRGHFALESGLHTDAWLELETAFVDLAKLQPMMEALAGELTSFQLTAVCGPLTGGALVAQAVATRLDLRFYFSERVSAGSGLFTATYHLPSSVRERAARERFAVVDDAISAGSATRATVEHLEGLGAKPVVVGSLWLLGTRGAGHFAAQSIPLVSVERMSLNQWTPSECPLCRSGAPLDGKARPGPQLPTDKIAGAVR